MITSVPAVMLWIESVRLELVPMSSRMFGISLSTVIMWSEEEQEEEINPIYLKI